MPSLINRALSISGRGFTQKWVPPQISGIESRDIGNGETLNYRTLAGSEADYHAARASRGPREPLSPWKPRQANIGYRDIGGGERLGFEIQPYRGSIEHIPDSAKVPINSVASAGEKVAAEAGTAGWHIPKPGLLATGITAGLAGYYAGDQDASSFGLGAVGGFAGGRAAEIAGGWMANHLESVGKPMGEVGQKALEIGTHLTSKGGRGALFAAGALLGGGMFASMFSSGRKSYKSGFNQNRGNSF